MIFVKLTERLYDFSAALKQRERLPRFCEFSGTVRDAETKWDNGSVERIEGNWRVGGTMHVDEADMTRLSASSLGRRGSRSPVYRLDTK